MLGDCFGSGDYEAHVRIFRFAERSWHTNVDGIERPNYREISGSAQFAALHEGAKGAIGNVFDIRMSGVELVDFVLLNIDADDVETRFRELDSKGQTDIAKAKNTNPGGLVADFAL